MVRNAAKPVARADANHDHLIDQAGKNRALAESENRFRTLCAASLGGICIVQGGCIRYANAALAEILAIEPEELDGAPFLAFVHPDDRARVRELSRSRLSGDVETGRYEARCVRKDGTIVHVEVLASRVDYGGTPALIGTILDVSDHKRAQSAMEDRLRFEKLLVDLWVGFINVPPERCDETLSASLKMLVEFLGNDRSTLARFTADEDHVLVTHSYAAPGRRRFPLGPRPAARLPWYSAEVRQGRPVFVRSLADDLPPEAHKDRQYCITHGIQSNVTVPLKTGDSVLGAITFDFLSHRCEWPAGIISRLHMIGEMFAQAIQRQESDAALRMALAENERLRHHLEQENRYLHEQVVLTRQQGRIVGRSEALRTVLAQAERVAVTDAPVLLLGETGTGKELLAHKIHQLSARNGRPMVIVNCASLPATLIESELFGRVAGAYTGATSAQFGRFAVADGSTLFLDEIGEFPFELQSKLLRVLQDGRFERLGSPETVRVDVRIIAATNHDLEQAVRAGTFRADLYHRLNVFPIHVPPLRDRRDDIPLLAWAFVEAVGRRMGKTIKGIPRKTLEQLQRYSWPGNVRELSNVIERAMILTTTDTLRVDLPSSPRSTTRRHMTLKDSERMQILQVLQETAWRIRGSRGAAEVLGLKPTTLEARMAKLGIKRSRRKG